MLTRREPWDTLSDPVTTPGESPATTTHCQTVWTVVLLVKMLQASGGNERGDRQDCEAVVLGGRITEVGPGETCRSWRGVGVR